MKFKNTILIVVSLFICNICSAKTYSPDIWGLWQVDNCQSTRTRVLLTQAMQSTLIMKGGKTGKCSIQSGDFLDPYTGSTLHYSDGLDIDHIVPRKWAWEHGASRWRQKKRYAFGNDPLNLVGVDNSTNRSKGDKPPSQWLPPNNVFQCEYVYRFNAVVKMYKLTYDAKEKAFVTDMLNNICKE